MRKKTKTKEEITKELVEIFRQEGFYGTTLTKLTKASNLEKTSLYHHFPKGKDEMAESVLLYILEDLKATVLTNLEEQKPPKKRLKLMFKSLR